MVDRESTGKSSQEKILHEENTLPGRRLLPILGVGLPETNPDLGQRTDFTSGRQGL